MQLLNTGSFQWKEPIERILSSYARIFQLQSFFFGIQFLLCFETLEIAIRVNSLFINFDQKQQQKLAIFLLFKYELKQKITQYETCKKYLRSWRAFFSRKWISYHIVVTT